MFQSDVYTGRGIQKRHEGYMTETTYITRQDSDLLLAFRILLGMYIASSMEDHGMVSFTN